jgi:hypothetical protein
MEGRRALEGLGVVIYMAAAKRGEGAAFIR